ncbi:bifunctional hydroxymethylpyrimidine kinase/phosphomethylpyrimidine kinase [Halosquirtibacter laminarini]|uniref:Bifunctional hydroxymethylpyrimidine kinase/phosphomethylpyrimidine kinase n=1 Tax=Halosquirtibacter laminarini TaxID=3374600 RepID=A0AC61NQ07_9BACT|nr:bifunctional hydroxymethylpyrimidine kinase/phosphomethylpyrimidine kinase [Prolixibacteraceae bacterium]
MSNIEKKNPIVLSIAGSDSSGGAGIQADIKTITTHGCYAATTITCVTSQNSHGIFDIVPIPTSNIISQIETTLQDYEVDAIKIGMVYDSDIIGAIVEVLKDTDIPIVIDPVMVASSSQSLTQQKAIDSMKKKLLPLATIITPNIPEAKILLGSRWVENLKVNAWNLARDFGCNVLLKTGHLSRIEDILVEVQTETLSLFAFNKLETTNTHGTGCTLSAAIASEIAKGNPLKEAVNLSTKYIHELLKASMNMGDHIFNGPMYHCIVNG